VLNRGLLGLVWVCAMPHQKGERRHPLPRSWSLFHTTPSIRIVHIARLAAPSTTYHRARVTSLLTLGLLIRGKVIVLTVVLIKFLG
jgi:hypothetical protein